MRLFLCFKNFLSKKFFTYESLSHSCTVKTMDEESERYKPTEFLKAKQNFFKDFCFKFEGLSDECEKGFTHIIKDLGGKVSKNAKYTLVEKSYSEKAKNKKRKDLYHLHFILDCLDFKKLLDIELYRCDKTCNENEENSPSILQNRTINCNDNIGNTSVRNNFSNDINSNDDVPIPEAITQSQDSDKTLKTTISNINKKKPCDNNISDNGIIDSATVRNNFSNESNSDDDIPISEMITPSKSQGNESNTDDDIPISEMITPSKSQGNESNTDDDIPISEMITPSKSQGRDKTLRKTVSKVMKRKSCNNISSNNGRINNTTVRDNISNEINSDNDIPTLERIKQSTSQQNNKTLKKDNSTAKKRKLCNPIRSDTESSSSDESVKVKSEISSSNSSDESIKIKPEPKSSDSSSDDSNLRINTMSKNKKVNVKSRVPSSSDESTNYESESEPSKRKRRKKESNATGQINSHISVSQNKTNSKATKRTWVDTRDLENNRNKDNNSEEHLSSNSPVDWSKQDVSQRADLKWLFEIDKNDLCEIKGCTFAPGTHESHHYAGRIISDEEKKIILQYLIKNNVIQRAKGIRTWEHMINEGYLTHRSADTLRNCLRRVILPGICRFKLPIDILDQFLSLDEKKAKGKKIW